MRLPGEERAVEHRGLEYRNLQPADQRLDAVGQVLGLEYEIEQHRHQLDGHRLELVGSRPEWRLLQIAQDVMHVLLQTREVDRNPAEVETGLAMLQPTEGVAELRRHEDPRAAEWPHGRHPSVSAVAARHALRSWPRRPGLRERISGCCRSATESGRWRRRRSHQPRSRKPLQQRQQIDLSRGSVPRQWRRRRCNGRRLAIAPRTIAHPWTAMLKVR